MSKIINKRYGESFKIKVVEELESGALTFREARLRYGITGGSTLKDWLETYGNGYEGNIVRVVMKSEEERIRELEKALADAHFDGVMKEAQLRAYAKRVPDIKKKLSSKELKLFEENERKIEAIRLKSSVTTTD